VTYRGHLIGPPTWVATRSRFAISVPYRASPV
jgi:hypothetical protein